MKQGNNLNYNKYSQVEHELRRRILSAILKRKGVLTMENKEMLELLQNIEKANRRQARMTTWMCIFSLVSALCFAAALVLVWGLVPKVEAVISQATAVMEQTQTVLQNLEQTTASLAAADLGGMVADVDALVSTGQDSLKQTMDKLNTIDFETLNKAIEDLAAVVQPLSRLANMFQ